MWPVTNGIYSHFVAVLKGPSILLEIYKIDIYVA